MSPSQAQCRFVSKVVLMKNKKWNQLMTEKPEIYKRCTFLAFLSKLDLTIGDHIAALQ